MKLNLNDDSINENGSGTGFDPSKIFGYSVVENNTIISTLEGVVLADITIPTPDNDFCDLIFKEANGNTTNLREYPIDPAREGAEKKQKNQITRLKHIITKYVAPGTPLPAAETFTELCTGIKQLLGSAGAGTSPMRLKLVYNDKGFLAIPKYVPFLESMKVDAANTSLSLTDFDKLNRTSASNPATMVAEGATAEDDDLPF